MNKIIVNKILIKMKNNNKNKIFKKIMKIKDRNIINNFLMVIINKKIFWMMMKKYIFYDFFEFYY